MPTKKIDQLSVETLVRACEIRMGQNNDHVNIIERSDFAMDAPPDADATEQPLPVTHHLQLQQNVAEAVIAMHIELQRARLLLEGVQNDMLMLMTRHESVFQKVELIPIEKSIHNFLHMQGKV